MFSEKKKNLTKQNCSLYLENQSGFMWPENVIRKRIDDCVKASMDKVYYLAIESSTESILTLSLQQSETQLIKNSFLGKNNDGL